MGSANTTASKGLGRREFLRYAGGAVGGAMAWGALAGRGAEAEETAAAPATGGGVDLAELEGRLGELVAEMEKTVPYASALYTESAGLTVTARTRERTASTTPRSGGVVLRVHDGRGFHEAATSDLSADGLAATAKGLVAGAAVRQVGFWPVEPAPAASGAWVSPGYVEPETIRPGEWVERADALLAEAQALDARQQSASASVSGSWTRSLYVDRQRRLRQSLLRTGTNVFLFGTDGKGTGRASVSRRLQGGLEVARLEETDREALRQEFNDTFRAERVPPGTYTVLSAPAVTGLLAHESFGHGVEYDMFIRGRARAAQFLGKRVAPEWVQIWDDPSQERQNGSYFFDDEGWLASPTQIVKDGVFVRPITDQYAAAVGRVGRTANGRRQSYAGKAYSRMSNTFFGRGATPVADLFASVEDGIFLDGFQSGMEDPHGWGIQLICRIGYEIKRGERTGRVFAPVGVGGTVPEILGSVTLVGDSFSLGPGTCGKGHKEWVPVADGGPHLVFRAPLG